MELTAVSATQFSVAQLTTILCDCFEDYLVPVTLSVEVFVQRFSAAAMKPGWRRSRCGLRIAERALAAG